jgi:hypothetical protein
LKDSGLTAKEFAAELGVNVHTLNGWRWKLSTEAGTARLSASAPFVEVISTSPPSQALRSAGGGSPDSFEVILREGVRIRVPPRFDAGALRSLLAALGGC